MGGHDYRACAFAPETGPRLHSGVVRVLADQVQFESGGARGALPLAGLRLRRGGHNDEQIFFEHPDRPGWSVYSSDPALLRDPVLSVHPEFRGVLRTVTRSRRIPPWPVLAGLGVAALIVGAVAALWLAQDRIAEFIADKIPVSWEEKFGNQVFQQITRESVILTNSPWNEPVGKIIERFRPVIQNSGYDFRFHIVQDTNVNAFAIPGGHVVILTGLLEKAETAEEVAGVLAHELAHVTRRHSLRNLVKSAGLLIVIQSAFGDASGLLAVAAEGSRYLLQQKFSRDFEREADDTGWSYLLEARIDPRGLIRFFEKLHEITAASGMGAMENSLALLNTHPASKERIDRLNAQWERTQDKSGFVRLGPWEKSN